MTARPSARSQLRAYQRDAYDAILAAVNARDAGIVVLKFSRQSGKNYVSQVAESRLLAGHVMAAGSVGGKAAPTLDPQATVSLNRLRSHLRAAGLQELMGGADTIVRLGHAEWWFGSGEPEASVVGRTANIALEFDEAQDFDVDKHDKDYSPMVASTAAPRIYYGTPWSDFDLLAQASERAQAPGANGGRPAYFEVPWTRVAEELPAYGLFVEAEMQRLGHSTKTPHPTFVTQYELKTLEGAGRLLNPAQLRLIQGDHAAHARPLNPKNNTYVAGLDNGGTDMSSRGDPDETVLTIGLARYTRFGNGSKAEVTVQAVRQFRWKGETHELLQHEIHMLLREWHVTHLAADATGIGEPIVQYLQNRLGERRVTALKLTRTLNSSIAFDFLHAVNAHALTIWQPDGEHHQRLWHELTHARREQFPGGFIRIYVDERDGHDDGLASLAYMLRAAHRGEPRIARARSFR